MKIGSQRDFLAGLMFIVVGAGFSIGATNYSIGEASRMGPGYFPFLLGIVLALMGLGILIGSLKKGAPDGDPVGEIAWRPLIFILTSNLAFGALLVGLPSIGFPSFGLIVAIYGLIFIAGYARPGHKLKESLILATILAVGSYFSFVYALNLQFPVWPAFLTN